MRKLLTLVLVLLTASIGTPSFAQMPLAVDTGSIAGEAVDAAGRPLVNERVELVSTARGI